VPHVYDALLKVIRLREPDSVMELEDCYFALDKEKKPELAEKLREQINALGGNVCSPWLNKEQQCRN
jgi:hypothetical protein